MNDEPDILKHISRTLRERHNGQPNASNATRERILASVRKQNKRRNWWFKWSLPGGVLLLGTTAWAQATHQWPAVWRTLGDILSLPVTNEGTSEHQLSTARNTSSNRPRSTERASVPLNDADSASSSPDVLSEAELMLPSEPAPSTAALDEAATSHDLRPTRPTKRSAHKTRAATIDEEPLPEPESAPALPPSEPEVAAFRAAHDLYVKQGNLTAALTSYRLYLRDYPNGRFVPEAHYNSGIIQLKLGNRAEARRELEPFARGKYGAHRKERASRLLEALEEQAKQ